jgi:cytoskeletal protein CcmA (bactofilin family)
MLRVDTEHHPPKNAGWVVSNVSKNPTGKADIMAQEDSQFKQPAAGSSRIGGGLSFRGDIAGGEDLAVDGRVTGTIDLGSHDLIVRQGGRVEADVRARNVTVHGELVGNVVASERAFISETGRMMGDVVATTVSVMAGAQFKGAIRMERRS